jgi:hypothetical protein
MNRRIPLPQRLGHEPGRQEYTTASLEPHAVITRVDTTLYQLHRYGLAVQNDYLPDYSQDIAQLHHLLDQSLEALTQGASRFSWQQYYELLSRAAFLRELAYAPVYLSNNSDQHQEIRQFTDGVYGLNAHLLADALEHYDNPVATESDRGHLRGVLHEQTAAALLNRPQLPRYVALPANHAADTQHKTDIIYYHRSKYGGCATNIQVKSDPYPSHVGRQTPEYGILVTSADMKNVNLETSRAIVAELYAESSHSPQNLDAIQTRFAAIVNNRIAARDARYAPYQTVLNS